MNQLFFGDNLHVLRESIKDESVDLVYLDPPFNSKRDYNLLFKSPEGGESHAQITAFEVHGTPKDLEGARELAERDKYPFQWWACSLVDAQPFQGKKKGADGGIDGLIYFADAVDGRAATQRLVVSVKGGNGKDYPRLQLLTVAELLDGRKRPEFPDLSMGTYTFKKAKKENLGMAAETPNLFSNET